MAGALASLGTDMRAGIKARALVMGALFLVRFFGRTKKMNYHRA